MGLFGKKAGGGAESESLTLAAAWQLLAPQLGAALEVRGERSVHATGATRGRGWSLDIEGRSLGNAFLRELRPAHQRNKPYDEWTSQLAVGCVNPRGVHGVIRSFVDITDPAWKPGAYDPAAGRRVVAEPSTLAGALTAGLHSRLMGLHAEVTIAVEPAAVHLYEVNKARADRGSFMAGSVLHQAPNMVRPMPDRAIAGPPWWIDLLCDVADAVDAAGGAGAGPGA